MKYLLTYKSKVYKFEIEDGFYHLYFIYKTTAYPKGVYLTLFDATAAIFTNKFNRGTLWKQLNKLPARFMVILLILQSAKFVII